MTDSDIYAYCALYEKTMSDVACTAVLQVSGGNPDPDPSYPTVNKKTMFPMCSCLWVLLLFGTEDDTSSIASVCVCVYVFLVLFYFLGVVVVGSIHFVVVLSTPLSVSSPGNQAICVLFYALVFLSVFSSFLFLYFWRVMELNEAEVYRSMLLREGSSIFLEFSPFKARNPLPLCLRPPRHLAWRNAKESGAAGFNYWFYLPLSLSLSSSLTPSLVLCVATLVELYIYIRDYFWLQSPSLILTYIKKKKEIFFFPVCLLVCVFFFVCLFFVVVVAMKNCTELDDVCVGREL
eukprot:gene7484-5271_t